MSLHQDTITFGKYQGKTLSHVLRDRKYCKWLIEQEWFKEDYEYLYNRIFDYNPRVYFLNSSSHDSVDFIDNYEYFNLIPVNELTIELSLTDQLCYKYYLRMLQEIRDKIYQRLENEEENPYDIKAPTRWLKRFEETCGIPRTEFKEFMEAYDLPNIPYIIERIKKEGGIEYKGAQSFKIAKSRSEAQEQWWEELLKERYGEDLGTQFKYGNCIFDMILIPESIIFECKLGLKDFDEAQYIKYRKALEQFRVIYLIGIDTVIVLEKGIIYTKNPCKCAKYLAQIPSKTQPNQFDKLLIDFDIVEVDNFDTVFESKSFAPKIA